MLLPSASPQNSIRCYLTRVATTPPIQFPVKASNLPSPSRGLVFRHQNLQGLFAGYVCPACCP
jgi:hypothetical protein